MEQLQNEITAMLWTFEKTELIKVCQHLKCSEPAGEGFKGQSRRTLIRLVESTLSEIEEGEGSHVFQKYISDFQLFMESLHGRVANQT